MMTIFISWIRAWGKLWWEARSWDCGKSRVNGYFGHTEISHQKINLREVHKGVRARARIKGKQNGGEAILGSGVCCQFQRHRNMYGILKLWSGSVLHIHNKFSWSQSWHLSKLDTEVHWLCLKYICLLMHSSHGFLLNFYFLKDF